jgi:N-6 DNA Methylase
MKAVEAANPELRDVLPRGYQRLEKSTLSELLLLFAPLPRQLSGDAFGLIYEDFLSNFAANEGRLGGEFSTPYSIVRLIVEMPSRFGCLPERRTRSGRRSHGRGAGCARGSGRPNAHGTDSCRRSGSPDRASSFGTHRDRGGVSRLRVWSGRNRRPLRRAGGWWGRQERGCPQRRSTARSRYNRGQRLRRRPRPSR